jgi:hypothetical protein
VTGRKRRCGWFDAVLVRQAVAVNGIDGIALTKLDVLDGLDEIKVCTGYRLDGEVIDYLPREPGRAGAGRADLRRRSKAGAAPRPARAAGPTFRRRRSSMCAHIEELIGAPVALLSTSPEREDTILGVTDDSFDDLEAALTDLGDQAPDQDGTAAAPPEPEPQAFQAESGEPLAGPETVAPAAIPASGTSDLEPPADAAVEERAEGIVPGSPDEGEPVDPAAAAVVTGHSATEPPESSQGPVPAPAGRVKPARRTTGLVAAVVALIVIGGAGYAVWLNLDDFAELVGASGPVASQEEVPVSEPAEVAADDAAAPPAEPVAGETDATTAPDAPQKFTQRLLPEGGEVDEGPAGEAPRIGEGTSVATTSGPAIEDPEAEVSPDEAAPDQPVAVGQRAISTSSPPVRRKDRPSREGPCGGWFRNRRAGMRRRNRPFAPR